MDKKGKIFQRKQREQPQQLTMMNPPLLEEKKVDEEETFEKWRVVNMQYRALFKKPSEGKFESKADEKQGHMALNYKELTPNRARPVQNMLKTQNSSALKPKKPERTADNQLASTYMSKKLENFHKSEGTIKRPALLIQSTEEMLRQLPKGESLLEEAEVFVSKNLKDSDDGEQLLREAVDEIHLKELKRIESGYTQTYDELCQEIEDLNSTNTELEQKIRKFYSQANSENKELEEVSRQSEQVRELEAARDKLHQEIFLMEETISVLNKDLDQFHSGAKERQEKLQSEIQIMKEKAQLIDNQKVESLEYECKELYKDIQDIEADLKKIRQSWEGDNKDLRRIMEEFDESNNMIKKELREITLARSVIKQERENIKRQIEEVTLSRVEYLKSAKEPVQHNPRNLYMYFDNILNHYARKIRMVNENKLEKEPENTVKSYFESKFFQDSSSALDQLKISRDILARLKEKHDFTAEYNEKEMTGEVAELVTSFRGSETKAISVSLKSLVQLSPIRHVSPARESSLSSLSRLRDITDKVIRHKRGGSNASKGSKGSKGSKQSKLQIRLNSSFGSNNSSRSPRSYHSPSSPFRSEDLVKSSIDLGIIAARKAEHARYMKSRK